MDKDENAPMREQMLDVVLRPSGEGEAKLQSGRVCHRHNHRVLLSCFAAVQSKVTEGPCTSSKAAGSAGSLHIPKRGSTWNTAGRQNDAELFSQFLNYIW